jgi:hypothetical protein
MMTKQLTKQEKEWKNLELGEMPDEEIQIGSKNEYDTDSGYDMSEDLDRI